MAAPRRLGRATKDVLFGSIAGMMSKVIEHPFDLVKVRLQTQPMHPTPAYTGAYDCFRKTLHREGFHGLFRGVSMPLIGATMENASLFLTYNQVQRLLQHALGTSSEGPQPVGQLAIAAAASGAVTGTMLTPFELIKCKMQVQMMGAHTAAAPLRPASALGLISKTVRESGVRGLWLGFAGTLIRETGGGMAWFLAFELATREMLQLHRPSADSAPPTKADLSSGELALAGALAGICYNVSLFPADSVKSTMQTERELSPGTYTSTTRTGFFATLAKIYRARGLRGLYAGVGVTCLRSAPSSGTSSTLTQRLSCMCLHLPSLVYNKLEQAADYYGF